MVVGEETNSFAAPFPHDLFPCPKGSCYPSFPVVPTYISFDSTSRPQMDFTATGTVATTLVEYAKKLLMTGHFT